MITVGLSVSPGVLRQIFLTKRKHNLLNAKITWVTRYFNFFMNLIIYSRP